MAHRIQLINHKRISSPNIVDRQKKKDQLCITKKNYARRRQNERLTLKEEGEEEE